MNKESAAFIAGSSSHNGFHMSKSKLNACRLVLLTSLIWVLFDAFLLLFYLNDCSTTLSMVETSRQCVRCELKLERLQLELAAQRKAYESLLQRTPKQVVLNKSDRLEKLKKFKFESPEASLGKDQLPAIFEEDKDEEELVKRLQREGEWFREDFSKEKHNPSNWPGENGRPVIIPKELKKQSEERFKENQFNVVASELVALNRSVPDQRSESCRMRKYPVDLPTTSIIIVHHNEANSTLLRTLVSIVRKTPMRYLKEIILVDDKSEDRPYLLKPLDDFVKTLPCKVIVMRNEERMGLMRSRLRGAEVAAGDTMTFLDAHVEVTNGWLPPLLYEIKKNRKTVACPIIDVIEEKDFRYSTGSETTIGAFNGKVGFRWETLKVEEAKRRFGNDLSQPMRTPTMAGGLFTIDRSYFYEIGTYDEGMEIWGAENIEMSFRVWMCGGQLLILPCSHVGHVFRKHTPYTFPGGTERVIYKNNRRMIDVWTDEYATYFHKIMPELAKVEPGDLTPRIELRKNLNCKSFRWYLENIYPDAPIPLHYYHLGAIRNPQSQYCLDSMGRKAGEDVGASECHSQGGNQLFEYSKQNQLKHGGNCLDTHGKAGAVRMETCENDSLSQLWEYDDLNEFFRNKATQTCLSIYEASNKVVLTVNCDPENEFLQWTFTDPMIIDRRD